LPFRRLILTHGQRNVAVWTTALAAIALTITGLILHSLNSAALTDPSELFLADIWLAIITPPAGAFLITRVGKTVAGAALLSTALLSVGIAGGTYATYALAVAEPGTLLAGSVAAWLATWTWGPYLLLMVVVPMLMPDGGALSHRWRTMALFYATLIALITVVAAFTPGEVEAFPHVTNPAGIGGAPWLGPLVDLLVATTAVTGGIAALVAVAVRWRKDLQHRREMNWTLASISTLVLAVLTSGSLPYPWIDLAPAAGFTFVLATFVWTCSTGAAAMEQEAAARAREQVQWSERARLGRDLHDSVGPELAGITLHLNAISGMVADHPASAYLAEAEQALRRTTGEIRQLMDARTEHPFEHESLAIALENRAAALSAAGQVVIQVQADELPLRMHPNVQVAAFRIASEAMTNVVKHAHASRCRVTVRCTDSFATVEVVDNGRGGPLLPTGTGMASMRRRVSDLGGTIEQGAGRDGVGSCVRAVLPLEPV
jgi:signal transduction histidine kinase